MRQLYISDTHFGHANIINFDKRPFKSVEEMDEALIQNWNEVVHKDDTVNILGDFCWQKASRWIEILKQLKGNKILIRGNHDLKSFPHELKNYFAVVSEQLGIVDEGRKVILNHYPQPFYWHDTDEKVYMLYGHVHNTAEAEEVEKLRKYIPTVLPNHKAQFYNCWCGNFNWAPATLDQIINFYKEKDNEIYSS